VASGKPVRRLIPLRLFPQFNVFDHSQPLSIARHSQ
jgi:hypothetical protein